MSFSKLLFLILSACLVTNTFASNNSSGDKEFDVSEMIMHHVKDAHEWHLWGSGHESVSIYLPVILFDNGLKLFSSSDLYHGTETSIIDHSGKTHHYQKGVHSAQGYAIYH
ncbi:MAG: hypothetical protein RLZ10_1943, partial [Bacteroidota bacterium]